MTSQATYCNCSDLACTEPHFLPPYSETQTNSVCSDDLTSFRPSYGLVCDDRPRLRRRYWELNSDDDLGRRRRRPLHANRLIIPRSTSRTEYSPIDRSGVCTEDSTAETSQVPPRRVPPPPTRRSAFLSEPPSGSAPIIAKDILPGIAARFINCLLDTSSKTLATSIKRMIDRLELSPFTTIAALLIIQKLRVKHTHLKTLPISEPPERLFLSSAVVAYKGIKGETHFDSRVWNKAAKDFTRRREIATLESEFRYYLRWRFNMTTDMIQNFAIILEDGRPYLSYDYDLLEKWHNEMRNRQAEYARYRGRD